MWWLVGVVASLLVCWLLLVGLLLLLRPEEASIRQSLRLLPDIVRLVKGLATDKRVPPGARALLWLLVAYLVSPVDVVPDFVPVIGFADDAILVALVLRYVVRRSDPDVVAARWPGTASGLASVQALAGYQLGCSRRRATRRARLRA